MKKKSEFGKINGTDLLNALYYFAGSFLLSASALFGAGVIPTQQQIFTLLGASFSAGLLNIFKNFIKDENGNFGKKEN